MYASKRNTRLTRSSPASCVWTQANVVEADAGLFAVLNRGDTRFGRSRIPSGRRQSETGSQLQNGRLDPFELRIECSFRQRIEHGGSFGLQIGQWWNALFAFSGDDLDFVEAGGHADVAALETARLEAGEGPLTHGAAAPSVPHVKGSITTNIRNLTGQPTEHRLNHPIRIGRVQEFDRASAEDSQSCRIGRGHADRRLQLVRRIVQSRIRPCRRPRRSRESVAADPGRGVRNGSTGGNRFNVCRAHMARWLKNRNRMMNQVVPCQPQRNARRGESHGTVPELEYQMVVRPRNQGSRDVRVAVAAHQDHLGGHLVEVIAVDVQPAARSLRLDDVECKRNRITNGRYYWTYVVIAKRVSQSKQGGTCPQSHEIDAAPEFTSGLRRPRQERANVCPYCVGIRGKRGDRIEQNLSIIRRRVSQKVYRMIEHLQCVGNGLVARRFGLCRRKNVDVTGRHCEQAECHQRCRSAWCRCPRSCASHRKAPRNAVPASASAILSEGNTLSDGKSASAASERNTVTWRSF